MTNWKPKGATGCTTQVEVRVIAINPYRELRFAFYTVEDAIAGANECMEHFGGRLVVADVMATVHHLS